MRRPAEAERRKAERRLRRLTHKPLTPARAYRRWRRRRRTGRRSAARSRLRVAAVGIGLAAVVVGVLAVLGWRDLARARDQVLRARAQLVRVANSPATLETPEGRARARQAADTADQHLTSARSTVRSSVPLRVAGLLPRLSDQRQAALRLLDNATSAGRTARALLGDVDRLADRLRVADGAFPVETLSELEAALRTAHGRLAALPPVRDRPWSPLADATDQFDSALRDARTRLGDAADGAAAARTFMGASRPQRYFLAAMNNAEMRDQGMVLSYAIVRIDNGRFTVERQGSTLELALKTPAPIEVPAGTQKMFGFMGPAQAWQSVNATADFGFSGRAMVAMYRHATGQQLDGVIALDVPGLASLLRVIGPLDVPGLPRPLVARDAGKVLLNELYEALPARVHQDERREVLGDVMGAALERVARGGYEPLRMARLLGRAAQGLHFRVHSQDPAVEDVFVRSGLGGGPATRDADRTIHFAVQNFTATKLDYFVRPEAAVDVTLDDGGDAHVTTRITIANHAPVGAAPSYQLGPDGVNTTEPGQYLGAVHFWGPAGSLGPSVTSESGLMIQDGSVEVMPGQRKTVEFTTIIPGAVKNGRLALRFVPQPRLFPVPVRVALAAKGWRVDGDRQIGIEGDLITTVSWGITRG